MDQIFDLVFHGGGGFTYPDVYNLPINIRSYYYAKLAGIMEQRNAAIEAQNKHK